MNNVKIMCRHSNEPACHGVRAGAYDAIQSEKKDLEAGSDSISEMLKMRYVSGFGKHSVDTMMKGFKRTRTQPVPAYLFVANSFHSNSKCNYFVKNFKRWLIAINLYTDKRTDFNDDFDPKEFEKKDFKLELAKINVPVDRFSVIQIESSMNIEALFIQNSTVDASAIAEIVAANFKTWRR